MSELTIYPEAFLNRMKNILGDEYDAFIQSLDESSPTSIRFRSDWHPANPTSSAMPSGLSRGLLPISQLERSSGRLGTPTEDLATQEQGTTQVYGPQALASPQDTGQ